METVINPAAFSTGLIAKSLGCSAAKLGEAAAEQSPH